MKNLKAHTLIIGLSLLPSVASAFCMQSPGHDFASSVDGTMNWLVCLHNEQGDSLSDHAQLLKAQVEAIDRLRFTLNSNAEIANRQATSVQDLEYKQRAALAVLDLLAGQIETISAEKDALQLRVDSLERRLTELGG